MIDRTHELPVVRQCPILELAGSTAYFQPQPVSETDLALMCRIDTLHLKHSPFARACMLSRMLKRTMSGRTATCRDTLRQMGIPALYRKSHTRRRHLATKCIPICRYLMNIRPYLVWAAEITCIPMKRGFVYLFAVMDWASRRGIVVAASEYIDHRLLPGSGPGGDQALSS
jgi:putative transposase